MHSVCAGQSERMSSKIIIKQQIVKRGKTVVLGVVLVAVIEENGGCVGAVVLCCKVDETHDLREGKAVEEHADRGVVLEDTAVKRYPAEERYHHLYVGMMRLLWGTLCPGGQRAD